MSSGVSVLLSTELRLKGRLVGYELGASTPQHILECAVLKDMPPSAVRTDPRQGRRLTGRGVAGQARRSGSRCESRPLASEEEQ